MYYFYLGCTMNKEEILERVRQAQVHEELCDEEFAKLIAEKEREECAKICEESEYPDGIDLAYLIRARGQE